MSCKTLNEVEIDASEFIKKVFEERNKIINKFFIKIKSKINEAIDFNISQGNLKIEYKYIPNDNDDDDFPIISNAVVSKAVLIRLEQHYLDLNYKFEYKINYTNNNFIQFIKFKLIPNFDKLNIRVEYVSLEKSKCCLC